MAERRVLLSYDRYELQTNFEKQKLRKLLTKLVSLEAKVGRTLISDQCLVDH